MRQWAWAMSAVVFLAAAPVYAQFFQLSQPPETQPAWPQPSRAQVAEQPFRPLFLDEPAQYPQLGPREGDEVNNGGVNFNFDIRYLNRYVYRGVDQTTLGHRSENSLQFEGRAEFDLGKLPHPFVGLFVNVFNEDPISRFEEVRPFGGLEWTLRPLIFAGGINAYLYPNRKPLDTTDVWGSLTLDDSLLFRTNRPILSPYIYGAFDVELYHGFYVEAGIKHEFAFENFGATLTPFADIAYVIKQPYFALPGQTQDSGFQHYDVGLTGALSMNQVFKFSRRHGEWSIVGYLNYSDGIANHLRADTRIWGGVGLRFAY
jgi:hypothetical protein